MKIDEFKSKVHVEPVILHTNNGRKGSKKRRLTIAAAVIEDKLVIARSTCGNEDQFRKDIGVSKSLGRLLCLVDKLRLTQSLANELKQIAYIKLAESLQRFGTQSDILEWPNKYNRKQVLQAIDYIK